MVSFAFRIPKQKKHLERPEVINKIVQETLMQFIVAKKALDLRPYIDEYKSMVGPFR